MNWLLLRAAQRHREYYNADKNADSSRKFRSDHLWSLHTEMDLSSHHHEKPLPYILVAAI